MKVHYLKHRGNWSRKLLCVTHTERPMDFDRCSREFLTTRYADPQRLPIKEPFHSLKHAREYSPWKGAVTVWGLEKDVRKDLELLAYFDIHDYKTQQVLWHRERLWVLGCEQIEVFDSSLQSLRRIEDPWLAGAHTICPDESGRLVISCSASDAILFLDPQNYQVVEALRVPETQYGHNYPLTRTDSVVEHYVHNDLQLTHLNCAWPWRGGILVSLLIQGAIGWFDAQKNYQELFRGYVGCHGIRINTEGCLYFCDSCGGRLMIVSPEGKVLYQWTANTRWLHDAHQISQDVYALVHSDHNSLQFVDFRVSRKVFGLSGEKFGAAVDFISYGQ